MAAKKQAAQISKGVFTASSNGAKGLELSQVESEIWCAALGVRAKPTKATAFSVYVNEAKDIIDAALRERMKDVSDKAQTAGQRRHIESQLFQQLSQEERDKYEAEAKNIMDENQQHFDQNVSDETVFQ